VIDKFVVDRVARHTLHNVAFGLFVRQRDSGNHVGAEVDAEDRDGAERQWNVGDDEEQERRDFRNVAGQCVGDRLLEVVENQTTFANEHSAYTLYSACQ